MCHINPHQSSVQWNFFFAVWEYGRQQHHKDLEKDRCITGQGLLWSFLWIPLAFCRSILKGLVTWLGHEELRNPVEIYWNLAALVQPEPWPSHTCCSARSCVCPGQRDLVWSETAANNLKSCKIVLQYRFQAGRIFFAPVAFFWSVQTKWSYVFMNELSQEPCSCPEGMKWWGFRTTSKNM